MGFSPHQLEVIKALDEGFCLCGDISSRTNLVKDRIYYILRGLRKWGYVDYNREKPLYYPRARRWYLTERFYKIYGDILQVRA